MSVIAKGIHLTAGNQMVFRNEKDGRVSYRTSVSHKNADESYTNAGIGIRFKNGVEFTDERTPLNIKSAKLDFFKPEDGYPVFYLFAFEADKVAGDEADLRRGLNLAAGQLMIFRNEKDGRVSYRTTVSHKNADETYTNASIEVRFSKGVDLPDRTIVDIASGKLDFYKNKDNNIVYYIRAFEFEIVG